MNDTSIQTACIRTAYGEALADYGAINENIVVLDADMSSSTRSKFFAQRFPDRFLNLGVAEAGMVDVAVGLALGGKIPFANTLAFLFALRAAEQVRTCVSYARTNVKMAAAYGGFCGGYDGPTHHSLCDLAVMRAIPNITIVVVADATEARMFVPAVAEFDGPVYLRLSRAEAPVLFDESHPIKIGRGLKLQEGKDVTLIGTGLMVFRCLLAAKELENKGISTRVIEIHTLKPLDRDLILDAAAETRGLVTAEEHSIIGGLGSAVAEVISEEGCTSPLFRVGIPDCYAETGPHNMLLDRYGMGVKDIIAAALRVLTDKSHDFRNKRTG